MAGRPRKRAEPSGQLSPGEARAILDARRAADPLLHYYTDNPATSLVGETGLRFLASDAMWRCIESGNRAGKTSLMQYDLAAKLRGKHPFKPWFGPVKILVIITRTDQAATVWGSRLLKKCGLPGEIGKQPWIPAYEVARVHNRPSQKHGPYPGKIELRNGSEYYMAFAGDPQSWLGLEGIQFDEVMRDEASGSERLSDELEARLWDAQSAVVRGDRPWGGGVTWGATETKDNQEWRDFKRKCQDGLSVAVESLTFRHEYFHLPTAENRSVSQAVREAARVRMSKEAYEVRALGQGGMGDRVTIYAQCMDDERHLRRPPPLKPEDNLWLALDPGWKDKYGLIVASTARERPRCITVREYHGERQAGYEAIVARIKAVLDGRAAVTIVYDPAMNGSKQDTGESYIAAFCRILEREAIRLHRNPRQGLNRNQHGHPMVQAMLLNRDNPEEMSIEVDPEGEGCLEFWEGLRRYRWKTDAEGNLLKETVQKDIEPADTLKYLASAAPCWTPDFPCGLGVRAAAVEAVKDPDEGLDPEMRLHRQRLRMSEAAVADLLVDEERSVFDLRPSLTLTSPW